MTVLRELLHRAGRGDAEACEAIVAEWGPIIRREIRICLRSAHIRRRVDSEDLWQSVFRAFFFQISAGAWNVEEPRQVLSLVLRLARDRTLNELAKQQAAKRDVRKTSSLDDVQLSPHEAAARTVNPLETLAIREWLDRCQSGLPPEAREIASRRIAGESWEDIGAALNISAEAVRKRLSRAVARVLAELGDG